jgi:hypothetical protein
MGRVKIISGGDKGLYTVQRVRKGRDIAAMKSQAEILETKIEADQIQVNQLWAAWQTEVAAWQSMIQAGAAQDKIHDQETLMLTAHNTYRTAEKMLGILSIQLETLKKQIQQEEQDQNPPSESAWCADYSTELTGTVDSIEIDGSVDRMLIAPGGKSLLAGLENVKEMTVTGMSPAQAFYNWAVYPGWQKWMPTYRTGVVTLKYKDDDDVWQLEVTLDAAASHAQSLDINPDAGTGVLKPPQLSVQYLTCHGAAFAEGDRVIVSFPERKFDGEAVVVGFVEEPKSCSLLDHLIIRIGDIVSVWCPETETVILPPVVQGSEKWSEYIQQATEIDYESMNDIYDVSVLNSVFETYPKSGKNLYLGAWVQDGKGFTVPTFPDYNPKPVSPVMTQDFSKSKIENGYNCRFDAYAGQWADTPGLGGLYHYQRAAKWEWNYNTVVPDLRPNGIRYHDYHSQGMPSPELRIPTEFNIEPTATFVLKDATGETFIGTTTHQVFHGAENGYWDQAHLPDHPFYSTDYGLMRSLERHWQFDGVGENSLSGEYFWLFYQNLCGTSGCTTRHDADREFDWHGKTIGACIRTEKIFCQFFTVESARLEGYIAPITISDVSLFCTATSTYYPPDQDDRPTHGVPHNQKFADFYTAIWEKYREHEGIDPQKPINFANVTLQAGALSYEIDPDKGDYPYTY